MNLGEDFEFADRLKTDTTAIRLLTGPYKDVVYRYTVLKVKEAEDKSYATMLFEYDLIEMGNSTETSLRKDKRFEQHIGLVLNTLLLEAADAEDSRNKIKGQDGINRKGDTEELVEE